MINYKKWITLAISDELVDTNSLSKHEKIATLLPAYNQGRLKFRRNALGLDQIKNELRKYNPDRKANDDNCIDALSGITWQNDIYPYRQKDLLEQIKYKNAINTRFSQNRIMWRV